MSAPQLVVHRDKELMAQAAAARLITKIVDAQAARGSASVVLTGGRNGNGLLAALAASPARDAIDWSRLDLWWGDERFLPEGIRNAMSRRPVRPCWTRWLWTPPGSTRCPRPTDPTAGTPTPPPRGTRRSSPPRRGRRTTGPSRRSTC